MKTNKGTDRLKEIKDTTIKVCAMIGKHYHFDTSYKFYYSENNIISETRLSVRDYSLDILSSNFIIGGVVLLCGDPKHEINSIFSSVELLSDNYDILYKHVVESTFLNCLKYSKLSNFLINILNSNLYLHYSSINLLYRSIDDIIDSCIDSGHFSDILILKNTLYKICNENIELIKSLLFDYEYLNISGLVDAVINIVNQEKYQTIYGAYIDKLISMLIKTRDNDILPFTYKKRRYLLLESSIMSYCSQIYLFDKSEHIFNNDNNMQKRVDNFFSMYGKDEFNYNFIDAENNIFIQASSVLIRVFDKLKKYLNSSSEAGIVRDINKLDATQRHNLRLLGKLIGKTDCHNQALIVNTEPLCEIIKMSTMFSIVND